MIYLPPPKDLAPIYDPMTGSTRDRYIGVMRSKYVAGFDGPGHRDGTGDYLEKPGSPGNERRVNRDAVSRRELVCALEAHYKRDDEHCVTYVARTAGLFWEKYPRINKGYDGVKLFLSRGHDMARDVILIDIDNPILPGTGAGTGLPAKKRPNTTPGAVAHWVEQLQRVKPLGFGFYTTDNGVRIVIALAASVYDADRYEGMVRACMALVESLGWTFVDGETVHVDAGCTDYTRLMRLPHVKRGPKFKAADHMDLSALRAQDFEPAEEEEIEHVKRKSAPRPAKPFVHVATLSEEDMRFAPNVSPEMIADRKGETRHLIMAACATVLCDKGVPGEVVPAVVVEMSRRMGIEPEHHKGDWDYAARTAELWRQCKKIKGFSFLKRTVPQLAEALDAVSIGEVADKLAEVAARCVVRLPVVQVADELGSQMEQCAGARARRAKSNEMVRIIAAPCGTGKTEKAVELVIKIGRGEFLPPGATPPHAARAKRTAYCAPAEKNLKDYQERAHKRGLRVLRLTSPMSERDDEGNHVCHYWRHAVAIGAGSLNVKRLLCDGKEKKGGRTVAESPCMYRDTCIASTGAIALDDEGQPYAVELGDGWHASWPHICMTHARMGVGLKHVGRSGTLILDERPLLAQVFPVDDNKGVDTIKMLGHFEPSYAGRARAVLQALRRVIATAELDKPFDLAAALPADVLAAWRGAAGEDDPYSPPGAPPVRLSSVQTSRSMSSPKTSKEIGDAAGLLAELWRVLREKEPTPATCRVINKSRGEKEHRELHITTTPDHVRAALGYRDAPVLVLDADAPLYEAEYSKLIPKDHPAFYSLAAEDGAPITRRFVLSKYGVRSKVRDWFTGFYEPGGGHVQLVRIAVDQLKATGHREHLIITWKPLALILRAAKGEDVAEEWAETGQLPSCLAPMAAELRPMLAEIPGEVFVLNYGAERGDDEHKTCPSVITLGDPIPNLAIVTSIAAHLKLTPEEAASYSARAARAQLGQAVDRIRPSRRGTPASMVHVGVGGVGYRDALELLYPNGWEGRRFSIESADHPLSQKVENGKLGGRPANAPPDVAEERRARLVAAREKAGGGPALAAAIGIKESRVKDCASGRRTIPDDVDAMVTAFLTANDNASKAAG